MVCAQTRTEKSVVECTHDHARFYSFDRVQSEVKRTCAKTQCHQNVRARPAVKESDVSEGSCCVVSLVLFGCGTCGLTLGYRPCNQGRVGRGGGGLR